MGLAPCVSRIPTNNSWVTDQRQINELFPDYTDQIHWITNPLMEHNLSLMTDKRTDKDPYCTAAQNASDILFLDFSNQLLTRPTVLQSRWGEAPGVELDSNLLFHSILRGATPLEPCIRRYYPDAPIIRLSASRDKDDPTRAHLNTTETKFPKPGRWRNIIIDQTGASFGTFFAVEEALEQHQLVPSVPEDVNPSNLSFICTFVSVDGLKRVFAKFPEIHIYAGRIIFRVDEKWYMIDGPGDAGLRSTYTIKQLIEMGYY